MENRRVMRWMQIPRVAKLGVPASAVTRERTGRCKVTSADNHEGFRHWNDGLSALGAAIRESRRARCVGKRKPDTSREGKVDSIGLGARGRRNAANGPRTRNMGDDRPDRKELEEYHEANQSMDVEEGGSEETATRQATRERTCGPCGVLRRETRASDTAWLETLEVTADRGSTLEARAKAMKQCGSRAKDGPDSYRIRARTGRETRSK
jgi:hypothetical protein